jgi:hypothetical protein
MWWQALACGAVWRRAAKWGVPIGLLQAVINQGDYWLSHAVNAAVITKTIVSPMVTFSVALISAAGMYVEKTREQNERNEV